MRLWISYGLVTGLIGAVSFLRLKKSLKRFNKGGVSPSALCVSSNNHSMIIEIIFAVCQFTWADHFKPSVFGKSGVVVCSYYEK